MPYQDRHPIDAVNDQTLAAPSVPTATGEGNYGRNIQIVIIVGLVAAVVVAIFGHF